MQQFSTQRSQRFYALFLLLCLEGCAIGSYGRVSIDNEVTRMFTTNAVPSNFSYYITGRSDLPDAIIGIDPRYRLISKFWEPVEANTESFARKVAFIWQPQIWDRLDPAQGGWMFDPQGRKVGIWYSMYPSLTFKVVKDFQVEVIPPRDPNGGPTVTSFSGRALTARPDYKPH